MKTKTIAQLKREADKHFSKAIRLRDSYQGFGECITCNKRIAVSMAHAGHFQSRRYNSTRYSDENVNLQCPGCNTFRAGEQYKYAKALDLKYGNGTAERLAKEAQEFHKLTREELEQIIEDAKQEIKFYENAFIYA